VLKNKTELRKNLGKIYFKKNELIQFTTIGDSISGKYGLINHKGKEIVPALYDTIERIANNFLKVGKRYTHLDSSQIWYGLINLKNEIVLPISYLSMHSHQSKFWYAQNKQKHWNIFDSTATLLTTIEYDSVKYPSKTGIWVRKNTQWGKLNLNGKYSIVPQYKYIYQSQKDTTLQATSFTNIQYIDAKGKIIIQFDADSIRHFNQNSWVYFQNEKCGIKSFQSDTKCIYNFISNLINHRAVVAKNKLFGLINSDARVILNFKYDSIMIDHLEYIRVRENNKWGIVDKIFFPKIPNQYLYIKNISNGLAAAQNEEGKWAYLNVVGDTVVPFVLDEAQDFKQGIAYVKRNDSLLVLNKKGQIVVFPSDIPRFKAGLGEIIHNKPVAYTFPIDYYDSYQHLGGKLCQVKCGNKSGILHQKGSILFPIGGDTIVNDAHHKIAIFHCDTMAGVVNYEGNYNHPLMYFFDTITSYQQNCALARKKGYWGGIDLLNNIRIAPQYEKMKNFKNGYWGIYLNGKWGFTDLNENIKVQPNYEDLQDFHGHSAGVKYKGKWNTISSDNIVLNSVFYDSIAPSAQNSWILYQNGMQGLTDSIGREIVVCRYEKIEDLGNGIAQVWKHGKTGIIDYFQNTIIPIEYQQLLFDSQKRMYYLTQSPKLIFIKNELD
jgi:hypothetical protein